MASRVRWVGPVRSLVAAVLVAAAFAGCTDDDSGDEHGGLTGSIDRAAAARFLTEVLVDEIGDDSPHLGAELSDDDCPVLGDRTVADLVADSGVDLDLEEGVARGYVLATGQTVRVRCYVGSSDGDFVNLTVGQTVALTASEHVRAAQRLPTSGAAPDATYEVVDLMGFSSGTTVVVSREEAVTYQFVLDGLLVAVTGDADTLSTVAGARLLAEAVDAALETFGTSSADPQQASLERPAVLDAFDRVASPEEYGPGPQSFDDRDCPLLDDGAAVAVADELGWPTEAADRVALTAGWVVSCTYDEGPRARQIAVRATWAVTVAEYVDYLTGPIPGRDTTVEPLDTAEPLLEGRVFVEDRGKVAVAGWVDNGIVISVGLKDGDDAEQVLAAVVPGVLETLGLD